MFRRSPRALIFAAAALIVTIATASVAISDLSTLHRRASSLGPEQSVVVARRKLTVGRTISARDLNTRPVYRSQLPPQVMKTTSEVIGRVVTVPIVKGGFVSNANLATLSRRGLDGALPAGTRAVRVAVAESIRPRVGAIVDLYATFPDPLSSTGDDTVSARVIAEGVLVLGVSRGRASVSGPTLGVTLLVSPRQAQTVAFATSRGTLSLALAPPEEARGR